MAIDEDGHSENAPCPFDKLRKARMIRLVELLDSFDRLFDRHAPGINLLRLRCDPGDGPEPACDTQRPRVGKRWQHAVEHARIEFVGLAIEIEIGAGKAGLNERRSELRYAAKQEIDESVFRRAKRGLL